MRKILLIVVIALMFGCATGSGYYPVYYPAPGQSPTVYQPKPYNPVTYYRIGGGNHMMGSDGSFCVQMGNIIQCDKF